MAINDKRADIRAVAEVDFEDSIRDLMTYRTRQGLFGHHEQVEIGFFIRLAPSNRTIQDDLLYSADVDHTLSEFSKRLTLIRSQRYALHRIAEFSRNDSWLRRQARICPGLTCFDAVPVRAEGRGVVGLADPTRSTPQQEHGDAAID